MKTNRGAETQIGSHQNSKRTLRRRLNVALSLVAALLITGAYYLTSPPSSRALSSGIVISQIYGNGGTSGAMFRNDFIELFNRGNSPVDVAGWSVQYAVGNGAQSSTWAVTPLCPTSCVIPAHTYFLVQEASSGANGSPLPTPDATGTIDLSQNNAKVALVNTTTALTTTGCPFPASVVDFVGFGNSANCSEGNAAAPNPGNNDQSICRNGGGFTETDNNANDFTLCAPNPRNSLSPSFAKLNSFTATGYENGRVLLQWQTGYEVDNLGFNIYRDLGGRRTRVNSQLVAGSALMVGPETALTAGRSYYLWDDASGPSDTVYWVEDVDLAGRSTWREPIAVDRPPGGKLLPPDLRKPVLLTALGASADQTIPVETRASLTKPTTAQLELQSTLASRAAVKLAIQKEGWYRVTQPELAAAGLDPKTDPSFLQMFADGQEQPIAVVADQDGGFGPSSAIEFYGIGIDAASTDKHVYWLVAGSQPGLRIPQVKGKGSVTPDGSFPYTVERRDRTVYFSSLRNGEKENFFGAVVAGSPVDQALLVRHLDKASSEQAQLEVAVQGVTLTGHRVRVSLNETAVGEIVFEQQELGVAKLAVSRSLLKEGQNQIRLISVAGDTDISLVDHIKLTYRHSYSADDDALRFTARGKQRVTIDGFSNAQIRVLDITDTNDVREVTASVEGKDSYSVTFSVPAKKLRTLIAFAADRIAKPAELIADKPSNLRGPRAGADLVIITRSELSGALEPLKSLRERGGLKVAVVDVEDIFDEFSFGQKSPQAVKDFLAFASNRWETSPRFVLLAGDASLDPKNYLGKGDFDLVPTKLVDTQLMETASDDWFTDFDDAGLAEIPVARLPVRTLQEAAAMIGKIVDYESSTKPDGVLLVSDSKDGFDFAAASAGLRPLIPAGVRVDVVDRGQVGDVMAKVQLMDGLNRGQQIVNYIGHGSVDLWKANLLTSADAGKLTNRPRLSLFIAMTCLNGYFQDPALDSLAESLLKAERGGAVAVWASSGMTTPDKQAPMDQQMFRLLFAGDPATGRALTLGEATTRAKAAVSDADVRRTWILFGDPSMKLR